MNKLSFIWAWNLSTNNETLSLNETILTCDPIFRRDTGQLTLKILDSATVSNFSTERCSQMSRDPTCKDLAFSDTLSRKQTLALLNAIAKHKTKTTDTRSKASLDFYAEDFGSLIMNRFDVTKRDVSTPWLPNGADNFTEFREGMIGSVQTVFRTLFLSGLATAGFEEFEWPLDQQRTHVKEHVDLEKLFVVPFVAIILLFVLAASLTLGFFGWRMSRELQLWDVDIPSTAVGYLGLWYGCDGAGQAARELLDGMARDREDRETSFEQDAMERYTFAEVEWVLDCSGTGRRFRPTTNVGRRGQESQNCDQRVINPVIGTCKSRKMLHCGQKHSLD